MIARIKINIAGTNMDHFKNVSISQAFDDHHWMSISIGVEDINQVFGLDGVSKSINLSKLTQDWSGQKITLTISQGETNLSGILSPTSQQTFIGLVTKIQLQLRDAINSVVVITATSPTISLDNGEETLIFDQNLKLSEIVNISLGAYELESGITPANDLEIPYVTQYRESSYHFIQRLAQKYGEWFFYDGNKLVFGKPARTTTDPVKLEYGSSLTEMSVETRLNSLSTFGTYYDYFTDKKYTHSSQSGDIKIQNDAKNAVAPSDKLFTHNTSLAFQNYQKADPIKKEVQNYVSMASDRLAVMTGSGTNLELFPGSLISVNDDVLINGRNIRTDTYGQFLVTKVFHFVESNGQYRNNFEAIPNDTEFPPVNYNLVTQRIAQRQPAIVVSTSDPEKMGRVKVRFPWQTPDHQPEYWCRVANLMSGKDQGVYFVPEIDEVVFVDFEFGNPDLPFVCGSMYHGEVKPGSKLFEEHNNYKGIITKGGNHILIDDSDGKESIKIYNKGCKNEIVLSFDGGSHIHIKSEGKIKMDADSIEMNAKNITIKAEEDLKLNSKNSQFHSDYSTEMFSKNSTVGIGSESSDVAISSPTEVRVLSDQKITLDSKGDVSIDAMAGLTATAMDVSMEGTTQLAVKSSGMATVDGGQLTTIKGTFVMIN